MARLYACAMTITEQLQFSVLTAPVATLDRRTLSQAWYSALYGSGKNAAASQSRSVSRTQPGTPVDAQQLAARVPSGETPFARALPSNGAKMPASVEGAPQDRRAPRSALARRIERAFLRPRTAPHKAAFTVEGDHGRVHVLLRSHGAQLKLIAICPPKARPHVAAALAQARYALAMRGIDLDADTRSEVRC